ncbi:hypothetical protein [Halorubrum lacusprofundi]|jgi:hypothetical protein|uniref:DUF8009 domain-containing protein n=1 Tax=Halorubrum lacusprofundi (strain ATCC 49239 / DSM 5036 / JCM 8891 / ACAM 34) TaxID=416348 RepID=B9LP02_HALLT|nr:hypothetical protein [Halorubrum lacusprofundi]ACM57090.1 conserved hypothetical protein [Halorubrum lacusprofundi ATCC 49239]MCG1007443.1 hypothetical protein [Halorubrum lacusprofundi]
MTDDDSAASDDPGRIRSIAVHRDDVSTALEATLRSDREVVLRVTPPFSGRMRARLHNLGPGGSGSSPEAVTNADDEEGSDGDPAPIHVDPRDLVVDVPPYPEVDETMANDPDADLEARRKQHTEAVESWREAVRESVVDAVELDAGDRSTVEVDVVALG